MKNWRTTLIGAVFGGLIAVQPLLMTGNFDLKQILTGFAVAALGYFAKDYNVSGTGK